MKKKWKPTPLPGVKRTPEQRAAYEQWQKHKAEIEADRQRMRAERMSGLRRDVETLLRTRGLSARGLVVSEAELKRGDVGLIVDRLVCEQFLDQLEEAVVAQLAGHGFQLKAYRTHEGVRLRDASRAVALINATRAVVGDDAAPILGNFLAPRGEHWDELRRRLWQRSVSEVLTELPASASETERARAVAASLQIRKERSREFGHTVILRRGEISVRFEPIPEHGIVQVPFEFRDGGEYLSGALRLKAPQDPLALFVFDRSSAQDVIGRAWLLALLGYAELTCAPVEASDKRPGRGPGDDAQRRGSKASGGSPRPPRMPQPRGTARGGSASVPLPRSLVPTAESRRYLTSYVAGHKRHLGAGRRPSPDARTRAEHLGISLGPNETWVRPHARGVPDDAALVFDWKTAPALSAVA